MEMPGREEWEKRNTWSNNGWAFSKINDRHQIIGPGSSKQEIYQKTPKRITFKLQKTKEKWKTFKEARGKNTLYIEQE